jgi:hypothetical protein
VVLHGTHGRVSPLTVGTPSSETVQILRRGSASRVLSHYVWLSNGIYLAKLSLVAWLVELSFCSTGEENQSRMPPPKLLEFIAIGILYHMCIRPRWNTFCRIMVRCHTSFGVSRPDPAYVRFDVVELCAVINGTLIYFCWRTEFV